MGWVLPFVLFGALVAGGGRQAGAPQLKPSARDMYVSCFLLVRRVSVPHRADGTREPFEPEWCSGASISAIATREGGQAPKPSFCLPASADVEGNPPDAMAYAYLDFFEKHGAALSGEDGRTAYLGSMIVTWPCPAQ